MKTIRKTTRRLFHRLCRRLTHGRRGPNYAQEATTAFRHFIRLHRRLMKLVPEVFDCGVQMHLQKQKEEDEARMQLFLPALEKVYGPSRTGETAPGNSNERCRNGAEMVQSHIAHLTPAKCRKVDALLEEKCMWMEVGRKALENMKTQPHFIPSFSLIARMMDAAFTMKRLVCGLETNLKIDPHEHLYRRNFEEDLQRIYGSDVSPVTEHPT